MIILAVVLLLVWKPDRLAPAEVRRALDHLRAANQPVTCEDLARLFPAPPPELDAGRLIEQATNSEISTGQLVLPSGMWLDPSARTAPLPQSMLTATEEYERANAPVLALLWRGTASNAWLGVDFSIGWPRVVSDRTNSSAPTRVRLVKSLCAVAASAAERGLPEASARAWRTAFWTGSLSHAREIFDAAICIACEDLCLSTLERMLNHGSFEDGQLQEMAATITGAPTNRLAQAFIVERARGIWVCIEGREHARDMLKSSGRTSAPTLGAEYWADVRDWLDWRWRRLHKRFYDDANFIRYLNRCGQRLGALQLPAKQALGRMEALDAEANADRATNCILVATAEPKLARLAQRDFEVQTKRATAVAALAVERWRRAHNGRLPNSLAELVPAFFPAVPTDPFDNQSLRYRKLGSGYVVYSVGPDFTDDGGKERPANATDSDHYDITFTLER